MVKKMILGLGLMLALTALDVDEVAARAGSRAIIIDDLQMEGS